MSVPHNIVMNVNNFMLKSAWEYLFLILRMHVCAHLRAMQSTLELVLLCAMQEVRVCPFKEAHKELVHKRGMT